MCLSKTVSEDARDGFSGADSGMATQVQKLSLHEETLPLFDVQSLDSISSNSSGLSFGAPSKAAARPRPPPADIERRAPSSSPPKSPASLPDESANKSALLLGTSPISADGSVDSLNSNLRKSNAAPDANKSESEPSPEPTPPGTERSSPSLYPPGTEPTEYLLKVHSPLAPSHLTLRKFPEVCALGDKDKIPSLFEANIVPEAGPSGYSAALIKRAPSPKEVISSSPSSPTPSEHTSTSVGQHEQPTSYPVHREPSIKPSQLDYKPHEPDCKPPEPDYKPHEPDYKPPEPDYKPPEPDCKPPEIENKPPEIEYKPPEPEYKSPEPEFKPSETKYKPPEPDFNPPEPSSSPRELTAVELKSISPGKESSVATDSKQEEIQANIDDDGNKEKTEEAKDVKKIVDDHYGEKRSSVHKKDNDGSGDGGGSHGVRPASELGNSNANSGSSTTSSAIEGSGSSGQTPVTDALSINCASGKVESINKNNNPVNKVQYPHVVARPHHLPIYKSSKTPTAVKPRTNGLVNSLKKVSTHKSSTKKEIKSSYAPTAFENALLGLHYNPKSTAVKHKSQDIKSLSTKANPIETIGSTNRKYSSDKSASKKSNAKSDDLKCNVSEIEKKDKLNKRPSSVLGDKKTNDGDKNCKENLEKVRSNERGKFDSMENNSVKNDSLKHKVTKMSVLRSEITREDKSKLKDTSMSTKDIKGPREEVKDRSSSNEDKVSKPSKGTSKIPQREKDLKLISNGADNVLQQKYNDKKNDKNKSANQSRSSKDNKSINSNENSNKSVPESSNSKSNVRANKLNSKLSETSSTRKCIPSIDALAARNKSSSKEKEEPRKSIDKVQHIKGSSSDLRSRKRMRNINSKRGSISNSSRSGSRSRSSSSDSISRSRSLSGSRNRSSSSCASSQRNRSRSAGSRSKSCSSNSRNGSSRSRDRSSRSRSSRSRSRSSRSRSRSSRSRSRSSRSRSRSNRSRSRSGSSSSSRSGIRSRNSSSNSGREDKPLPSRIRRKKTKTSPTKTAGLLYSTDSSDEDFSLTTILHGHKNINKILSTASKTPKKRKHENLPGSGSGKHGVEVTSKKRCIKVSGDKKCNLDNNSIGCKPCLKIASPVQNIVTTHAVKYDKISKIRSLKMFNASKEKDAADSNSSHSDDKILQVTNRSREDGWKNNNRSSKKTLHSNSISKESPRSMRHHTAAAVEVSGDGVVSIKTSDGKRILLTYEGNDLVHEHSSEEERSTEFEGFNMQPNYNLITTSSSDEDEFEGFNRPKVVLEDMYDFHGFDESGPASKLSHLIKKHEEDSLTVTGDMFNKQLPIKVFLDCMVKIGAKVTGFHSFLTRSPRRKTEEVVTSSNTMDESKQPAPIESPLTRKRITPDSSDSELVLSPQCRANKLPRLEEAPQGDKTMVNLGVTKLSCDAVLLTPDTDHQSGGMR